MTVWVEQPSDGGSAVWFCESCFHGAWCPDHESARAEAAWHAEGHLLTITILRAHHGPVANAARDNKIHRLRAQGASIRAIALAVGISTAGVLKALKRPRETA